ncbi:hypothetical protein [Bifidobacterium castoris]|uniref:Scaffolding protein n=1 Tax=Bifidobacterium castoris TaxID=2306972 RepID=A0A430F809_9BIFI|nr:hypothetical protein [Bifidobacterium castoris]RSX48931.1 hypothetical protein D2E22_1069 [Bifidobacterium castoris]
MDNETQNDDVQTTATEPATTEEPPQSEERHDDAQQSDDQLGEGGLKALRAERAARKAAEQAAKAAQQTFEQRLQALEAENAKMKAAQFDRRVTDAASGKLKTPTLALKLADVSEDMTDEQLVAAIDKLLKDCPELAAEPASQGGEDPFRFSNHVKSTPQNAHDMNALAFANMVSSAINR